jgi:hypothetical protein
MNLILKFLIFAEQSTRRKNEAVPLFIINNISTFYGNLSHCRTGNTGDK